jgi:Subtilase family
MVDVRSRAGHPGYNLLYTFRDDPSPDELADFQRAAVAIRPVDAPIDTNETPAATLGAIRVSRLSEPTPEQRTRLRPAPVLGERRGSTNEPVGIDTEIWTGRPFQPISRTGSIPQKAGDARPSTGSIPQKAGAATPKAPAVGSRRERIAYPPLESLLARIGALEARRALDGSTARVVVAVIDTEFAAEPGARLDQDPGRVGPVEETYFPRTGSSPQLKTAGSHGSLMTRVVVDALKGTPFFVRRIQIPPQATSHLLPTDLAVAVAEAVSPRGAPPDRPPADVVLIPLSSGRWGMPPHLDAVLTEAARAGRAGRGAVIVCSTGRTDDNQSSLMSPAWPSAALGADELGSHPDVLLVGPCDLAGRWLRRYGERRVDEPPDGLRVTSGISGRMGPAVAISAPGVCSALHESGGLVDESSLASAIVAGVAGLLLQASPLLDAREVRHLLRRTALIPRSVDAPYGPEAANLSEFARDGHNVKVGAGMVNALAVVLAARDPLCQTLLQISVPAPPPPELDALLSDPALLIARWFDHWVRRHAGNGELASGYRAHRPALARLLPRSSPLREELGWVMRHLFSIFTHDGGHAWFSPSQGPTADHGALRRRLRRLVGTLLEELLTTPGAPGEAAKSWAKELAVALGEMEDPALERLLLAALLGYSVDDAKGLSPDVEVPYRHLARHELG